ncbi:proton-coupled zinc antiporter SLC30A2 isoform X1 [Zonotrichia albicollis]|uniref:proton-coupled zinc antiporter SLC30A2 isoform X1 n=1 Tax=Zonotrichia albicollis TaxID=44394 RepID=UPI003D80BA20
MAGGDEKRRLLSEGSGGCSVGKDGQSAAHGQEPALELGTRRGQHCHTRGHGAHPGQQQRARRKLYLAAGICLFFMVGEAVGECGGPAPLGYPGVAPGPLLSWFRPEGAATAPCWLCVGQDTQWDPPVARGELSCAQLGAGPCRVPRCPPMCLQAGTWHTAWPCPPMSRVHRRVPGTQPGHPDGCCPPADGLCQHHDQSLCPLGVLTAPHQNHELRLAPGRDPGRSALRALHLGGDGGPGLPGGAAPALGGLRHRGWGHAHHLRLRRGRQHRDGAGSAPDRPRAQPRGGRRAAQRQRPSRLRARPGGPAAEPRRAHRLLHHLLQARVQVCGSHLHLPVLGAGAGHDADHPPGRAAGAHGGDPQGDGFQRRAGHAAGGAGRGGRAQPAHLGADRGTAAAGGAHRHQRGRQRAGGAGGGELAAAGRLPLPQHHHPGGELLRGDAGLPGVPAPPRLTPGTFHVRQIKQSTRGCVCGGMLGPALSPLSAAAKDTPRAAVGGT